MHTVFKHLFSYLNIFKLFYDDIYDISYFIVWMYHFFKKGILYILLEWGRGSPEFATTTKSLEIINSHNSNLSVSYFVSTS